MRLTLKMASSAKASQMEILLRETQNWNDTGGIWIETCHSVLIVSGPPGTSVAETMRTLADVFDSVDSPSKETA